MVLEIAEKSFHTGTIPIHYAEGPANGPVVVLLHGGSANWQYCEGLIQRLSAHWHVYAPDLRGHGKSGRMPWGYSLREFAADTGAFLQQVSGPAALFGHSLGGIVALMTTWQYAQEVRALLVGDSPLDAVSWRAVMDRPGHRETQQRWRELSGGQYAISEIKAGLKATPTDSRDRIGPGHTWGDIYPDGHPIYEHIARRLIGHDPDVLGMLLEDYATVAAGYEMSKILPAIQCPVLLMQADPDAGSAMSDEEAAHGLRLLRHGQHVKFTGLSHMLFMENLEWVAGEMEKFLEQSLT